MIQLIRQGEWRAMDRTKTYEVTRIAAGVVSAERAVLPAEQTVLLTVNGRCKIPFHCSPGMVEELVAGFLVTAGWVLSAEQILKIAYHPAKCHATAKVDGWSSGCTGTCAPTTVPCLPEAAMAFRVPADTLLAAMNEFRTRAERPGRPKGMHATAISGTAGIVAFAEDVSRNNTVDKAVGACLLQGAPLYESMLLTTGRIGLEMALKALRAGIPIIASFKGPTTAAVELARSASIALAGRVTASGMIVFSAEGRIL